MVKLSIIIPYFETFELTDKLMRELLTQTYMLDDEVEIILIDDGCNEKKLDAFNNEHIKVIHQDNIGVAKTRNEGIDLAQGKYIAFIDCDDMITMNYIDT